MQKFIFEKEEYSKTRITLSTMLVFILTLSLLDKQAQQFNVMLLQTKNNTPPFLLIFCILFTKLKFHPV